ncbi:MAG: hypothetical protein ABL984_10335 [Pyrinomonadaceae bacterium]
MKEKADKTINAGKTIGYGMLIWLIGFFWGSVVFMTPALNGISPIPYVSRNPAISFPILLIWLFLTTFLARRILRSASEPATAGIKLGTIFVAVNVLLDLLILVLAFNAGLGFFASITVWIAYAILLLIPIFMGRSLQED